MPIGYRDTSSLEPSLDSTFPSSWDIPTNLCTKRAEHRWCQSVQPPVLCDALDTLRVETRFWKPLGQFASTFFFSRIGKTEKHAQVHQRPCRCIGTVAIQQKDLFKTTRAIIMVGTSNIWERERERERERRRK